MRTTILFCTLFLFSNVMIAQKVDLDHQLLWRVSSPDLEQDSYIYGTMHVPDPKVFNFSDSVYVKIGECKYFSLEVHPDTVIKNLIVDPFNSEINKRVEQYFEETEEEEEMLDEISDEVEKKLGLDVGKISKDNIDMIPFYLNKLFKKNKDKDALLDAHLYHIARLLDRQIVGLESISDHKRAIRSSSDGEIPDLKTLIKEQKAYKKFYEEIFDYYVSGDVESLYQKGGYALNSVLAYRNEVMVNTSVDYIEDGGIFMAVGAAHLAGEMGMVKLLRNKGYKVEPVKATFSKKMINADLADQKLDWVTDDYPDEGFSVSLPDHAYNYMPSSLVGLMKVRSYPDLGLGHFFFYSVTPAVVDGVTLESLEEKFKANVGIQPGKKIKETSYSSYQGERILEIGYVHNGVDLKFRYVIRNNYLYIFGMTKMGSGNLNKKLVDRFFNSVNFYEVEEEASSMYVHEKGAFQLNTNLPAQTFTEVDDSEGPLTISEFVSFFDQQNQIIKIVSYTGYDSRYVFEDPDYMLDGYELNFRMPNDSLVYIKDHEELGGKELHILYPDNTFVVSRTFVKGNRLYQIMTSGKSSEENYTKSIEFIDGVEFIDYAQYETVEYEGENFRSDFLSKPELDTISEYYELPDFSIEAKRFGSVDENSAMNFYVIENDISPYVTYENIDSCLVNLEAHYLNYNDSLLSSSSNGNIDASEFMFHKRGNNKLDFRCKMLLTTDKLYELHVVQDSAAVNEEAISQLFGAFKLNDTSTKESLLYRDSSFVKGLVKSGLFVSDTIESKKAASVASQFKFNEEECVKILNDFNEFVEVDMPSGYLRSMLNFFSADEMKGLPELYTTLENLYLKPGLDTDFQFQILGFLISMKEKESIAVVKSLLQENIPEADSYYDVTQIFYDVYDSLELVMPLFPELIDLSVVDSTIAINYAFSLMLEDELIDYETLSPLHELIKEGSKDNFDKLQSVDEDNVWEAKSSFIDFGRLYRFSGDSLNIKKYGEFLLKDTLSSYYALLGAEWLLASNASPDLSGLYDRFNSYESIMEMYELKYAYPDIAILPDSMFNLLKYAEVVSLTYPEEEEYADVSSPELFESYSDDKYLHYFFKAKIEEYDSEILSYASFEKQEGDFKIPDYSEVYTNYIYIGEEVDFEKAKSNLLEYYELFKKDND